jgi:adenylate kinase
LQQLADFLQSTAADAPRLAVVAAVPGQGKSALLAQLWQDLAASPQFAIRNPQS